jgi:carbamate kinase
MLQWVLTGAAIVAAGGGGGLAFLRSKRRDDGSDAMVADIDSAKSMNLESDLVWRQVLFIL